MIRKIIKIEEEKCDGCGLCADACHEGAIAMIDGKAKLARNDCCDGLGNCLPVCPAGAISFEEREAAAFDEEAVKQADNKTMCDSGHICCPGTAVGSFTHSGEVRKQWPIQIKLVPVNAPYFNGADLMIAADCTAFTCKGFYQLFMKDKITIIGCPKLDNIDYSAKLAEIIRANNIKSVTVIRMEAPCCGGIAYAADAAIRASGKSLPLQDHILSTEGVLV